MIKKEVINYLEENELDIQNVRALPFICDMVFTSYAESHKVHKINFAPIFLYLTNKKENSFYPIIPRKNILQITKKVYFKYLKDKKSLDVLIVEHTKLTEKFREIWMNYEKKKETIQKTCISLLDTAKKWWHYGSIGEDKGGIISTEIAPKFAKRHNITISKASEIINILAHPNEQTILNLERIEFLNICLCYDRRQQTNDIAIVKKDDAKINKLLEAYLKKFFWIKSD